MNIKTLEHTSGVGLSAGVLVINQRWEAIGVTHLHKAISWLFTGDAQAAHQEGEQWLTFNFQEWCEFGQVHASLPAIHTTKLSVPKPLIVLLKDCVYRREPEHARVPFSRQNIFMRDNYTCQYCGVKYQSPQLNLDHVIPRHQKGITNWKNIVCSCYDCNTKKANRTPSEAGMKLLRQPKEPKGRPIKVEHPVWHTFLDQAYWCTPLITDIPQ
jgi:hypothetical protein